MATDVQLAEYPLMSPKAKLKPEKKSGRKPRSPGDSRPQKELVIPGIVDFERIRQALRTPKPQTPGTYCFGRLSHHSFFSRHHPHPQHVTHIQDLTGKPVCVVRDSPAPLPKSTVFSGCQMGMPTVSAPIGDPQSNRNPQLSSGPCPLLPEAWKKELKDLASRVAFFTKEDELKKKEQKEEEEEPLREQGAKYSAETGRLIPASTRAVGRRRSHQGQQSQSSSRDEGVQAFPLQDQELLGILTSPGIRFSGPVGRGHRAGSGAPVSDPGNRLAKRDPVLAALRSTQGKRPCSGTPADSSGSAPSPAPSLHPYRKAPKPAPRCAPTSSREARATLQSIPEENEDVTFFKKRKTRVHWRSSSPPDAFKPEHRGEDIEAEGRELRSPNTFPCLAQEQP
ncbi:protein TBATA isoform X1 [Macaca nemestrina]|uniref:protein TBATA isoform X1 n=1 Tax=Macaca nemestrina TaxID=9545 RepID=UPI0005F5840D|nr:protein TBATA isoform X1 [Macaca nemestrina]XP_011713231.1 protein TBATA isoform X1 [Macaca nemestrina]